MNEPKEILDTLEKVFNPKSESAEFEYIAEFSTIHYDPEKETASEFNQRYTALAEKLKKMHAIDLLWEKKNYIRATFDRAKEIAQEEKMERKFNPAGLTIFQLKERLLSLCNDKAEAARCAERNDGELHLAEKKFSGAKPLFKIPGSQQNAGAKQPAKPFCRCGHNPDGHTTNTCKYWPKIYCYCCQSYGTHKRDTCPDKDKNTSWTHRDRSTGRPEHKTRRPTKKFMKFKKATVKKIENQRKYNGNSKRLVYFTDDKEEDVELNTEMLDDEELEYALFSDYPESNQSEVLLAYERKYKVFDYDFVFLAYRSVIGNNRNYYGLKPPRLVLFAVDCGATIHVGNKKHIFTSIRKYDKPKIIGNASGKGKEIVITELGDVMLRNPHTNKILKLTDVEFSPECPRNLLSESKLRHAFEFHSIGDEKLLIDRKTRQVVHVAQHDGRLWNVALELPLKFVQRGTNLLYDFSGTTVRVFKPGHLDLGGSSGDSVNYIHKVSDQTKSKNKIKHGKFESGELVTVDINSISESDKTNTGVEESDTGVKESDLEVMSTDREKFKRGT